MPLLEIIHCPTRLPSLVSLSCRYLIPTILPSLPFQLYLLHLFIHILPPPPTIHLIHRHLLRLPPDCLLEPPETLASLLSRLEAIYWHRPFQPISSFLAKLIISSPAPITFSSIFLIHAPLAGSADPHPPTHLLAALSSISGVSASLAKSRHHLRVATFRLHSPSPFTWTPSNLLLIRGHWSLQCH